MNRLTLRLFITVIVLTAGAIGLCAQDIADVGSGRKRAIKGYYPIEIDGEQTIMMVMNELTVFPELKFKNKKEEEFYWKTVRDVRKTLPYAKVIC